MTPIASILGYAGLIPFVGLAVFNYLGYSEAKHFLISYAALIFSFLGGVQWMANLKTYLKTNLKTNRFINPIITLDAAKQIIAVSIMLWTWLWLLSPNILILQNIDWSILAGLSFWFLWLFERTAFKTIYSIKFMQLRRNLSFVAGFCLIITGLI